MAHLGKKGNCEENLSGSLILTTYDNHQTLNKVSSDSQNKLLRYNEAAVSPEETKEDNTTVKKLNPDDSKSQQDLVKNALSFNFINNLNILPIHEQSRDCKPNYNYQQDNVKIREITDCSEVLEPLNVSLNPCQMLVKHSPNEQFLLNKELKITFDKALINFMKESKKSNILRMLSSINKNVNVNQAKSPNEEGIIFKSKEYNHNQNKSNTIVKNKLGITSNGPEPKIKSDTLTNYQPVQKASLGEAAEIDATIQIPKNFRVQHVSQAISQCCPAIVNNLSIETCLPHSSQESIGNIAPYPKFSLQIQNSIMPVLDISIQIANNVNQDCQYNKVNEEMTLNIHSDSKRNTIMLLAQEDYSSKANSEELYTLQGDYFGDENSKESEANKNNEVMYFQNKNQPYFSESYSDINNILPDNVDHNVSSLNNASVHEDVTDALNILNNLCHNEEMVNKSANNEAEYMETDSYYDDDDHSFTIVDDSLEAYEDLNIDENYYIDPLNGKVVEKPAVKYIALERSQNIVSKAVNVVSQEFQNTNIDCNLFDPPMNTHTELDNSFGKIILKNTCDYALTDNYNLIDQSQSSALSVPNQNYLDKKNADGYSQEFHTEHSFGEIYTDLNDSLQECNVRNVYRKQIDTNNSIVLENSVKTYNFISDSIQMYGEGNVAKSDFAHSPAGEILQDHNYCNKLDEEKLESSSSSDISRAIEKYKVFYADQGVQASPCTIEKMCQTDLEFDQRDNCKRCLQFDETEPNKRMKVSHKTNELTDVYLKTIRMETSPTDSKSSSDQEYTCADLGINILASLCSDRIIEQNSSSNITNNDEMQSKVEEFDSLSPMIELEDSFFDQIVPTPNPPSPQIDLESKRECSLPSDDSELSDDGSTFDSTSDTLSDEDARSGITPSLSVSSSSTSILFDSD